MLNIQHPCEKSHPWTRKTRSGYRIHPITIAVQWLKEFYNIIRELKIKIIVIIGNLNCKIGRIYIKINQKREIIFLIIVGEWKKQNSLL